MTTKGELKVPILLGGKNMADKKTRTELVTMILGDEADKELEIEELLQLLLEHKVSKNVYTQNEKLTVGQRMSDNIAKFVGSWTFILIFMGCLILWIIVNTIIMLKPFDAYPFILLNLILSCVAAIQAPVIMMSQNRQEEKDRTHSQNDYKVNLKSELIIEDLHKKIDQVMENQEKILLQLEEQKKNKG